MHLYEVLQHIKIARSAAKYRVSFEHRHKVGWLSDFFPERHESALTYEEARTLAEQFAEVRQRRFVNIHLIDAYTFKPMGIQTWNSGYASS